MEDVADIGELAGEGPPAGRVGDVSMIARSRVALRGAFRELASRAFRLGQLYAGQTDLILPGRSTQGDACARFDVPAGAEMLTLECPGNERVTALFGGALEDDGSPRPDAATRPTILFFYGNAMCLARSVGIFQHLRRIGANVLIPDYAGFGLSTGRACEAGCYATADAAYRHLLSRRDIDPSRVVAGGASLGGAVAIDLASREPGVAGVIALVTFTSIPDMARHLYPDVPIWRFIRHKFDSVRKMPAVACPVLIGHSTGDSLVPEWMADRLAAASRGPVTRFVIEGADHAAAEMLDVAGDVIFKSTETFLETLARR
jgi:pimeloyl-ACP methyl ester carboxylesterase